MVKKQKVSATKGRKADAATTSTSKADANCDKSPGRGGKENHAPGTRSSWHADSYIFSLCLVAPTCPCLLLFDCPYVSTLTVPSHNMIMMFVTTSCCLHNVFR